MLPHVRNKVVLARKLARAHVAGEALDPAVQRHDVAHQVLLSREFLCTQEAAKGTRAGVPL